MPAQPGVFTAQKSRSHIINHPEMPHQNAVAGPSRVHDESRKERKRKDISGKVGKEMNDRREDGRHYGEHIQILHSNSLQLATRPESAPGYNLRMLPLTMERAALLTQIECEEKHALDVIRTAFEEERNHVEEEWKKGRDLVRERLLEGIEERRRRARDEKESEGTAGDSGLDSQSRPHITRKLRNKVGNGSGAPSPPGTPINGFQSLPGNGVNGMVPSGLNPNTGISSVPITSGPFLNPHSLNVDELPSPFPIPLTSASVAANGGGISLGGSGHASYGAASSSGPSGPAQGAGGGGPGRRRPKGSGTHHSQAIGGLGKSIPALTSLKEVEMDEDMVEIRRGSKRKRATAAGIQQRSMNS